MHLEIEYNYVRTCECATFIHAKMKKIAYASILFVILIASSLLSSCHTINTVLRNNDRDYKLEVAKQMYAEHKYSNAYLLLDNVLPAFKNTKQGDEALFLVGMCKYNTHDYESACELFKRYYSRSYPNGMFVNDARYYAAKSFINTTSQARLDQSNTYTAINELQTILDSDPQNKHAKEIKDMLFMLQDRLVEKEMLTAKLYYDLGDYFLNCNFGGSNYQACIVTAQNAIKTFPYTPRKEELAFLILKAKYHLAVQSIESKKFERYNDAVDEYYGFVNEFPQSKHLKQAKEFFDKSEKELKSEKLLKYKTED